MIKYGCVVSMQGDDADEAFSKATFAVNAKMSADVSVSGEQFENFETGELTGCAEWCDALGSYLGQWEYGDPTSDEVFDDGVTSEDAMSYPNAFVLDDGEYIVTYHYGLTHCALYRRYESE